jgi:hypothetical protein
LHSLDHTENSIQSITEPFADIAIMDGLLNNLFGGGNKPIPAAASTDDGE